MGNYMGNNGDASATLGDSKLIVCSDRLIFWVFFTNISKEYVSCRLLFFFYKVNAEEGFIYFEIWQSKGSTVAEIIDCLPTALSFVHPGPFSENTGFVQLCILLYMLYGLLTTF